MKDNTFAKKLKELRMKNGLSQTDLAKELECSRGLIGSIENGSRDISKIMAVKLADFFDTDSMYWLDESSEIIKLQKQNSYTIFFETLNQLKKTGLLNKPEDVTDKTVSKLILQSLQLALELEEKKGNEN